MQRSTLVALIALGSAGCPVILECADDEVADTVAERCVPADSDTGEETDVTPTDSDAPTVNDDEDAIVRIEWDVEFLPNDNVLSLECRDGSDPTSEFREQFTQSDFTFFDTYSRVLDLEVGQLCRVTLEDERGGFLSTGRVFNCSQEVASWEGRRGLSIEAAEFTVFGCIPGCVDEIAENYDPLANLDNDSCIYVLGCTDERANNYNPAATKNDGSCDFGGFGVTEIILLTDDSPSDTDITLRCNESVAMRMPDRGDPSWNSWDTVRKSTLVGAGADCHVFVSDEIGDLGPSGLVKHCGETVLTWERTSAENGAYVKDVGSFYAEACSGCTDPRATNFDADALVDDGTCTLPN